MREKGGILEVTIKKVDVDTVAAREHADLHPGSYLRLTVRDTGHGISSEILQRIFEPYFTTRKEGTGLGLALVKNIILLHGGSIDVKSSEMEGTTFMIRLPLKEPGMEPDSDAS